MSTNTENRSGSFPDPQKHKRGQPKEFDIIFDNPRKVYKAGDTIKGSVIIHLDHDLPLQTSLDVTFSGKASVQFSKETGGKHRQHFMASERYFKTSHNLHPTGGISAGQHQFPFTYRLPAQIPSSFEAHYANVRYYAKAKLIVAHSKDVVVKHFFAVFRPLDLNFTLARHPIENESELSMMCCASGQIEALIRLQKRGFMPGETVPVRAEVKNNTSSRITKMYFTVEQSYECFAGGRSECGTKALKSATPPVEHGGVSAHSSATWDALDVVTVPVTVPTGLDGCNIIELEHKLVLNLVMGGALTCNRAAKVDMIIGTVPLANRQQDTDAVAPQPNMDSTPYHRERIMHYAGNHTDREMEDTLELPSYPAYAATQV
ncbi:arrestin domain-containing protein 3-like isoform X2 [Littorina saxatilis]|uniref:arrestin domain-containing protein 3-like isoform X2 n=1 Tax=Littorina saxatilis TaxID=31220 RepID=UPI0038B489E5